MTDPAPAERPTPAESHLSAVPGAPEPRKRASQRDENRDFQHGGHQDPFGVRLRAAMQQRGPLCVGIDPHAALLAAWGLPDTPAGLERFSLGVVEAVAPYVAAVKPQSAFFERHGSAGIAVLERTLSALRDAGTLAVLDVKRGDIGSTAAAYAQAYLEPGSSLAADAVTVSPYLGFGALRPFLDTARRHGRGVFVLALTSNPEGAQVQAAVRAGRTVAGAVLAGVAAENRGGAAEAPLGSVGCVVGATLGSTEEDLDVGGPLLVPGLGAQGGTPQGLRTVFAGVLDRVLAASSREVLRAGPDLRTLRDAARATSESLDSALSAP